MIITNKAFTMQQIMQKVYAWMCVGLLISAVSSYGLLCWPALFWLLFSSKFLLYTMFGLQLALVVCISACINRISYITAASLFTIYSLLLGITLAPLFVLYTMSSIALTFVCTAGMFGTMALYGYYTNADLSRFGNVLLMALWGLVIASLANWFFQSSSFEYLLSMIGVLLFTVLTAYDVQKIKEQLHEVAYVQDHETYFELTNKIALFGALQLYLDFVNLFLRLLSLMGKKRK